MVVLFSSVAATVAKRLRKAPPPRCNSIGSFGYLIAAQARRRDAAPLTQNTREFERVPGAAHGELRRLSFGARHAIRWPMLRILRLPNSANQHTFRFCSHPLEGRIRIVQLRGMGMRWT